MSSSPTLLRRYQFTRQATERICAPLSTEDYVVQAAPEASPAKWHLAHTSWFFENFVLRPNLDRYRPFRPGYDVLFNSYYKRVGPHLDKARRGLLSRPTVEEVYRYRAWVDRGMEELLEGASGERLARLRPVVALGLNHEQQHQELLLTDLKLLFWINPLRPAYRAGRWPGAELPAPAGIPGRPRRWLEAQAGVVQLGNDADPEAFDNERPRHRALLGDYRLATAPVANGEWMEFIDEGGYRKPELWLSDGWDLAQAQGWEAPLYWERDGSRWWQLTLEGMARVEEREPVCHVSFYEADAFARWRGARLPTEAEWEHVATRFPVEGNFADNGHLRPLVALASSPSFQLFGDVWEWTASAYLPYPGFRPLEGSLGEYNGKFMSGQMVLRGGSCATPAGHVRPTYRNYFPPGARWQFSGVRLAEG